MHRQLLLETFRSDDCYNFNSPLFILLWRRHLFSLVEQSTMSRKRTLDEEFRKSLRDALQAPKRRRTLFDTVSGLTGFVFGSRPVVISPSTLSLPVGAVDADILNSWLAPADPPGSSPGSSPGSAVSEASGSGFSSLTTPSRSNTVPPPPASMSVLRMPGYKTGFHRTSTPVLHTSPPSSPYVGTGNDRIIRSPGFGNPIPFSARPVASIPMLEYTIYSGQMDRPRSWDSIYK